MIKEKKNRKLHGTVLLTVVMVMSLLIIFLFSTLTLATAANNRAHVNYSTAQTQVTSRTVVDAALKAMELDANYASSVAQLESGKNLKVPVTLGSTVDNAGRYGDIDPVLITYEGSKRFFNSATNEWEAGDVLKFTSTVSMAGVDSTTSAYIVKQKPGDDNPTVGNGAGFVTTASANLSCQTNLCGGSYISLPELLWNNATNSYYSVKNGVTYTYDYTNPATYRDFDESSNFKLYNSSAFAEADLFVNDNLYVENWSGFVFPAAGKGITVWGNMYQNNSTTKYVSNVTIPAAGLAFNKIPYLYVDGKITQGTTDMTIGARVADGETAFPMNVFCGSAELAQANIAADVYCMDSDKTSKFGGQNKTLYSWTASVINKADPISTEAKNHGSLYSAGSVELNKMTIEGDVRVAKNVTITGDVVVKGDMVVGEKLTINSGAKLKVTGDIYCNNIEKNGTLDKESNYIPVATIEHEPDTSNSMEIDSIERKYFKFTNIQDRGYGDYRGLFDEKIYSANKPVTAIYYRWKEDFNPTDLGIGEDPAVYTNEEAFFEKTGKSVKDYLVVPEPDNHNIDYMDSSRGDYPYAVVEGKDLRPTINGSTDGYLVETSCDTDGNRYAASVPTNETSFLVDTTTYQKLTNYYTVPTFDGAEQDPPKKVSDLPDSLGYPDDAGVVWYNKKTKELVSKTTGEDGAMGYSALALDTYADSKVYPKYAEKLVILGLEEIEDIPVAETKIISTMADIIKDVANPYKYANLDGTLQSKYDALHDSTGAPKDATYFCKVGEWDSYSKLLNRKDQYAQYTETGAKKRTTYTVTSTADIKRPDGSFEKGFGDYSGNGKAFYIDEDCVINMDSNNDIVINPGSGSILVVIEHLSLSNGAAILVDDSSGGTVNFFLDHTRGPGDLNISADGGTITTIRYEKAFCENKDKVWYYNTPSKSSDTNAFNLGSLGKPRVNIYGSTGSKLYFQALAYMVANVLSPNLELDINAGGSNLSCSALYYNGTDIKNPPGLTVDKPSQYVFGCLNTKTSDLPNQLNVLYITDLGGMIANVGEGDEAFEYRIMYYDEY